MFVDVLSKVCLSMSSARSVCPCSQHGLFVHVLSIVCLLMSSAMFVCQCPQQGLFQDICDGLHHARVMIACMSKEYAESENCRMEYQFATNTLEIPTLLAIVGTNLSWQATVSTFRKQMSAKQHLQYETSVNGVVCWSDTVYVVNGICRKPRGLMKKIIVLFTHALCHQVYIKR